MSTIGEAVQQSLAGVVSGSVINVAVRSVPTQSALRKWLNRVKLIRKSTSSKTDYRTLKFQF